MISDLRRILSKWLRTLPYFGRTFRLVQKASGPETYLWFLLLILQGALPAAVVYLVKMIVDSLTTAPLQASWRSIETPVLLVVLLIGLQLFAEMLRVVSAWLRTLISSRLEEHIMDLVHGQAIRLDLSFYESPGFYDHLHLARYEASWRPFALLENTGSLFQNGVTLVTMCIVLMRFGAWVPIALVLSTLPALFVVSRSTLQEYKWKVRNAPNERISSYYDEIITDSRSAGEIRLFGLGDYFRTAYQNVREKIRTEHLQLIRRRSYEELAAGVAGYLVSGGMLVWMILLTIRGLFSLGDLALFYQAFYQGQSMMRSLLTDAGQIYGNGLFLEKFYEYLSLQPQIRDPALPLSVPDKMRQGVAFQNVTFRYPGSSRSVLDHFSLVIPAGQFAAIVGPNGGGKSTLIKLLCRLYDPESGIITLEGKKLQEFRTGDLRYLITVLFQEPVHFSCTVEENIRLGDISAARETGAIQAAATDAGAHEWITRLPDRYNSILGKWLEGGTDLSVGEWQRLCLARAFYRSAQVILLDEPTSSMDPWAEAEWMRRFRNLVQNRTGIIITHRFTTAMHADVIHVMNEGRIIESGTHEELLAHGGDYARSWETQIEPITNAARSS